MKKVLIIASLLVTVLLSSCGTSASYYASSEFEDGIYYRPSKEAALASAKIEDEVDELIARTKREAARFTDTIVISGATASVDLEYRPDTRYALVLDNDSAGPIGEVNLNFNFDDYWYGYRNYNYWDYWYMANNWPWCGYWGYYDPWFGPGWGIGFGWSSWYGWGVWFDPWYGPWYNPWYAWYGPWYGPWYYDYYYAYAPGFYHGYLAGSAIRQREHNAATARKVSDIRAAGGGRSLQASAGSVQVGSNIRGRQVNFGESYVDRGASGNSGRQQVSANTFRRSANINSNVSSQDVRNNYYNRNNAVSSGRTSSVQVNTNTFNRSSGFGGSTTNSLRNTGSYGTSRSSYSGSFQSSGTSVRSGGGTRSGGGRR